MNRGMEQVSPRHPPQKPPQQGPREKHFGHGFSGTPALEPSSGGILETPPALSPARGHWASSACPIATADTSLPSAARNVSALKVHVQGFLFPCFPLVESVVAN